MDFFKIVVSEVKSGPRKGELDVFPDFQVGRSKDLLIRGKAFDAIWDEEVGLWSKDEYDVQRLVDAELSKFAEELEEKTSAAFSVKYMRNSASGSWKSFRNFVSLLSDNSHELDGKLTFANTKVEKNDYVSRRLPYSLEPGDLSAWDEMVGTLYSVEERAKLEWAIGSIVAGDSQRIQKFVVLYGPAGTGKSTILNIVQTLFTGYVTTFEASALGSSSAAFAMEAFKGNPLVAIQHDGDLSKISDNTKLNSVVAHEEMRFNEKYKPGYDAKVRAFLFMGTNQPVKITDAKSGIIRRLIDVHPTGVRIPANHYTTLMTQIDFELGAIAHHCLEVYREMGKNYYNGYRPLEMMLQTDVFFNFVEYAFDTFKEKDGTTLAQAYAMYKEYCANTGIERVLPQYKVREELRNYFEEFKDRGYFEGTAVRSVYLGFTAHPFKAPAKDEQGFSLVMDQATSSLDEVLADQVAQYQVWDDDLEAFRPKNKWPKVKTTLSSIDTREVHYVRVPENHIVIDFDLKDPDGSKSLERNLEAASGWPPTYGEISQGGSGVHLHYLFDGDVHGLGQHYSDGIEVKTLLGDAALRRRVSRCNNVPVATISTGLPLKEKVVLGDQQMKSEQSVRRLITRALRKDINPGTKTNVDFIKKVLDDARTQGLEFDVSDMKPMVIAFANRSTNQSHIALKTVQEMIWKSDAVESSKEAETATDAPVAFFDVEVYPDLFVVCWKYLGDSSVVKMVNPTASEIEELLKLKLIGFYNRRYDNHILWARMQGYNNQRLFEYSQKLIVDHNNGAMFGSAYNLSYADIWDFSSLKQSLKKFQIQLGLSHVEIDLPWDKPVGPEMVNKVVDYCVNDVITTEAVFVARQQDFVARQILASLSGLSVNDTTQKHTAKIIFEGDRYPQSHFIYTELSKEFPGYEFELGKSMYRGEVTGEGGYVYAEPGMYEDVALLDVASMHPTSIQILNVFGDYTKNFSALLEARLAIKHGDYTKARDLLGGKLRPFLENEAEAGALSYALKIVINIVYGLTSAKFDNPFRHIENKDNIVAKRGALFMIDLKHFVQEQGYTVAHIKTDSIKIPNATPEIIDQVTRFGEKYGYTFEHEATYDKFVLVNDAVYVARSYNPGESFQYKYTAVGAQFQHPYVYKSLFTKEELTFDDHLEQKQVTQGVMYLDFRHDEPEPKIDRMAHIGKNGVFMPVVEGAGGGVLYREKDGKLYAVTGTKGYLWVTAEMAATLYPKSTDVSYFEKLVKKAKEAIEEFGEFEAFVS